MRQDERGFTLIELLVALSIFALIAAAGVALLAGSVSAQAAIGRRLDETTAIQRMRSLVTADLIQALPRISRTEQGTAAPAFYAEGTVDASRPLLKFVRAGRDDLDGAAARPTIEKVEYWLVAGQLERRTASYVDGAAPSPPATMLDDVRSVRLRFRDAGGGWRGDWAAVQPDALPTAVEMTLERRGAAALTIAFLVGPGAPPAVTTDG